jgi:ankyrin repeat protein
MTTLKGLSGWCGVLIAVLLTAAPMQAQAEQAEPPQECTLYGEDADSILLGSLIQDSFSSEEETQRKNCIQWSIGHGANPNGPAQGEIKLSPPLIAAIRAGEREFIKPLLARGANPNAVDENGVSALTMAASSFEHDALRALLDAGADTKASASPLYLAVAKADAVSVRLLLDHGADVNAISWFGSDSKEAALDISEVDLQILRQFFAEKAKAKDADAKELVEAGALSIVDDHSPPRQMQMANALNLPPRSLEQIFQDATQINGWLKAVRAKCANSPCGGDLAISSY